ncbi:MAG: hypothetical protein AMJ46_01725 [Latescibacteria bacterium DG_63]|nr:MAG: hypothetical protein AMJ46_01725 [Latescibacteria bacterium DG_63]
MRTIKFALACVASLLVGGLVVQAFGVCPEGPCDQDCKWNGDVWYEYYNGQKWPDISMPVPYYIHKDGASDCVGDEFRAIKEGAKAWEYIHQAYFAACYIDTTSTLPSENCGSTYKDGKNVVGWKDLGGGSPLTLGRACWWYKTSTDSIIECDMTLNDNAVVKWSALGYDSCITDRFDVQGLATHEFGHWLSLGHSCDTLATMYCWVDSGVTFRRTPNDCDIQGMKRPYFHTYGVPKPSPGCWPLYLSESVATMPALGDIDRDGIKDIVFGTSGGLVYAVSGRPSELYSWPCSSAMGSGVYPPALGDINDDGWLEVVFASTAGKVYAVDHYGEDLVGWPKNITGVIETPAIGDIDGDGSMEVVGAATDSMVYAWNGDGSVVPGWPYKAGYVFSGGTAGLADLDGDDSLEVVVAAYDEKIYAIKPHGTDLSGWPASVGSTVYGPIAIGDIDSDDEFEIVVPSPADSLFAVNADGSLCTGWPVYASMSGECCSKPSLGDLDGDGTPEVLLGSREDSIYAYDGNGSRMAGWPVYVDGISQEPPIVVNIDSDAGMEVIVATWNGNLYAFDGNGTMLSGWPVDFGELVPPRVAVGDVNGDQEMEVALGCSGGNICSFHLGTVESENKYQWSTYGHDNHRTCRYGYVPPEVEPIVFSDFIATAGNWDIATGGGGYGGITTNHYSAPYGLGIQSGPSPGDFASAYSIPIVPDFERTYEASFYFSYDSFNDAKWFVFGHARLFLQSPGTPLLFDPIGDWSSLVPIGPPVSSYLPQGVWEKVEIRVDPEFRILDITVGSLPLGPVSYSETVVPSNRIWFSDEPYPNSEMYGYYDDFEIRGYLPIVGVAKVTPPPAMRNVLYQSFPNPMNPFATIRFLVSQSGHVTIRVFDIGGRLIRTLVDEYKVSSLTPYSVVWDGKDERGSRVASGVYFYQMEAKNFSSAKKIVILR